MSLITAKDKLLEVIRDVDDFVKDVDFGAKVDWMDGPFSHAYLVPDREDFSYNAMRRVYATESRAVFQLLIVLHDDDMPPGTENLFDFLVSKVRLVQTRFETEAGNEPPWGDAGMTAYIEHVEWVYTQDSPSAAALAYIQVEAYRP